MPYIYTEQGIAMLAPVLISDIATTVSMRTFVEIRRFLVSKAAFFERLDRVVKYSVFSENELLFASKYMLYMPTEEELKKEIDHERRRLEDK